MLTFIEFWAAKEVAALLWALLLIGAVCVWVIAADLIDRRRRRGRRGP